MKCQRLSNASTSEVFKPSSLASHTSSAGRSSQDELLISDTELRRLHTLGKNRSQANLKAQIYKTAKSNNDALCFVQLSLEGY